MKLYYLLLSFFVFSVYSNILGYTWKIKNAALPGESKVEVCTQQKNHWKDSCQTKTIAYGETKEFVFNDKNNKNFVLKYIKINEKMVDTSGKREIIDALYPNVPGAVFLNIGKNLLGDTSLEIVLFDGKYYAIAHLFPTKN